MRIIPRHWALGLQESDGICEWIGFVGKILTGNHGFSHWIWGFPVNFPLNQSIESGHWSNLLHEAWLGSTWKTVQASTDHPSTAWGMWHHGKRRRWIVTVKSVKIPCVGHDVWSVSPHVLSSNVWIRTLANCFARFLVGSHRTLQTRSGRDFITSILTSMQVAWQSTCGSG